jgi:UDP-glucose 4-epimerase
MTGQAFDRYSGSPVLITGGLGFVGSHLAARLVGLGAEVTIIDSLVPEYGGNLYNIRDIADRVRINISDVRDPWSIRYLVRDKEFIFNLAGQVSHLDSMENPHTDLEINAASQLSLLEACRRHNPNAQIVFAASRQQYGRPKYLPVDEEHPLAPVDVNGINLIAGESYHLLYDAVYGIRTISLRMTNTYGPHLLLRHERQGFITTFLRRALLGEPIRVFGDGSQLRDVTYVSDAAEAFLLAGLTDSAYGRAFNLGGQRPVSLLDVAVLCQELAGAGGTVTRAPWPRELERIDIGSIYLDHTLFSETTGWQPKVDLREGLAETIAFYREHSSHYWTTGAQEAPVRQ